VKRLLVLLVVLSATTATFAQDTAESQAVDETTLTIQNQTASDPDGDASLGVFTAWDFIKMALILAAVVAVIYGLFYVLKRTGGPKFQESRLIKVLSSKTLSGTRALHLVEIGNQIFLVGASENNVNLVSEILDKETLDGLRLQAASADAGERKNFTEILAQVFGRPAGPKAGGSESMSFLREQRQRVKNM
jgi:flagellar protein FliO/FliZ